MKYALELGNFAADVEFSGNGALSAGGGEGRGFGGDVCACISTSAGVSPDAQELLCS